MTSAITRLKLLGDRADELTKWQADVELREAEHKRKRDREAREQQRQAANISQDRAAVLRDEQWFINCLNSTLQKDGLLHEMRAEVIAHQREQMKDHVAAEIAALRGELGKLREEFRLGMGRVPIAKSWDADEVCHTGDVVSYGGETFQALQDTGKPPAGDHPHWRRLAARGVDGIDGRTPKLRGVFDAYERYRQFDIVTCDGNCYIACDDDPGLPGHDDSAWQLMARRGGRGPEGAVGPRGRKGERGRPGRDGLKIVDWAIDRAHYAAYPIMSDGSKGPVLQLGELFQQFLSEGAIDAVVETAVTDAARSHKLLAP